MSRCYHPPMSSPLPALIVVTGLPCSGKSMLAEQLRAASGWPLLAKDEFKETLFATLGWRDREWSRQLSAASYALMFQIAGEVLAAGQSVIIEGNFRAEQVGERLQALLQRSSVDRIVQILCTATPTVLLERWEERVRSDSRHPGHADAHNTEMTAELRRPFAPLPLQGPLLEWDSSTPDEAGLQRMVTQALAATGSSRVTSQRPSLSSTSA